MYEGEQPIAEQPQEFQPLSAFEFMEDVLIFATQPHHHHVPDHSDMPMVVFLSDEVVEGDVGWDHLLQILFVHE